MIRVFFPSFFPLSLPLSSSHSKPRETPRFLSSRYFFSSFFPLQSKTHSMALKANASVSRRAAVPASAAASFSPSPRSVAVAGLTSSTTAASLPRAVRWSFRLLQYPHHIERRACWAPCIEFLSEKSGNCELQAMAQRLGVNSVRYAYSFPKLPVDVSQIDRPPR